MTSSSSAHELCERFGYPNSLRTILERIAEAAQTHLGPDSTVLLSPSVATGDFVWGDGGNRLWSDVDGFAFTDAPPGRQRAFASALDDLSASVGAPFHIDIALNPIRALRRIARTYQMVETRLAGCALHGPDVRGAFPTQFDPRASRQAFLQNLWKPLKARAESDVALRLAIARVLSDIPTLSSSEQGLCVPGHATRAKWFQERDRGPLAADESLRQAVACAARVRREPDEVTDVPRSILVPAVRRVASLLDGRDIETGSPEDLARRLEAWLPPRSGRRILGELRCLLRGPQGLGGDIRWWLGRKEAWGGAAVLRLLASCSNDRGAWPGVALLIARYSRRPALDPESESFLQDAVASFEQGFAELHGGPASLKQTAYSTP